MKNAKSLYVTFAISIFIIVTIFMSISATFSYVSTKNSIIENMKESSENTINTLKNNLTNLISSYAVNEYTNLLYNEIKNKDISAIVVRDYNMGKIVGKEAYIIGKIRIDGNIVDFNAKNKSHVSSLKTCYYKKEFKIKSMIKKDLGHITLCVSDEKMKEELHAIIYKTINNTILISLFLIVCLFALFHYLLMKPISKIISNLNNTDKDGIPVNELPLTFSKELNLLNGAVNKMLYSIKSSRNILKKSESRLKYLLEMSPIAVRIAKNKGTKVVFSNHTYASLIKEDYVIDSDPSKYYKDKNEYKQIVEKIKNKEKIFNRLVEFKIKDKTVWALASYMSIKFDQEDSVIGWFYDVTREKNLQKELINQKNEFEAIFKYTKDGLALLDLQSNFLKFNEAYLKLTGYTKKELLTKSCIGLTAIEDKARTQKAMDDVLKDGSKINFEKSCLVKDGRTVRVNLSLVLLPDKKTILLSAKDITEQSIIQSQAKLASMGEMIGNIAHQWRQPLNIISTIASSIKVKNEFGQKVELDDLLFDMTHIMEQTQYLSKTIDDFRNFIKDTNEKELLSIVNTIEKTLVIIHSSFLNNNIKIIKDYEDDIEIAGYQNQLIQAIMNILNNSKDAIIENIIADDKKVVHISTKIVNENFIVSIKDSGKGIDKDNIDKVFEPYFTTKHQSVGTGIGLSLAHQIITEHHNASIEVSNCTFNVNSKEYNGACFNLIFKI
ncbi:PAS domain S-box protein [Malaciobacter canalis]|uniref:PAS domain-containing sensor histidine kinase n=1 Tax=Malaciobacter canalis TaxID=1912871 RepID=UPI00384D8A58